MKTLFIFLTVLASLFAKPSFARSKDVTPAVLHSFQSAFTTAKEVTWTATHDFYKAIFMLNGESVAAFYKPSGELVALTRNITALQLPIALQESFKKEYKNYWVSDLFEVANEEGTTYYLTLENADAKVVLKSNVNEWNTYQKSRKL